MDTLRVNYEGIFHSKLHIASEGVPKLFDRTLNSLRGTKLMENQIKIENTNLFDENDLKLELSKISKMKSMS